MGLKKTKTDNVNNNSSFLSEGLALSLGLWCCAFVNKTLHISANTPIKCCLQTNVAFKHSNKGEIGKAEYGKRYSTELITELQASFWGLAGFALCTDPKKNFSKAVLCLLGVKFFFNILCTQKYNFGINTNKNQPHYLISKFGNNSRKQKMICD